MQCRVSTEIKCGNSVLHGQRSSRAHHEVCLFCQCCQCTTKVLKLLSRLALGTLCHDQYRQRPKVAITCMYPTHALISAGCGFSCAQPSVLICISSPPNNPRSSGSADTHVVDGKLVDAQHSEPHQREQARWDLRHRLTISQESITAMHLPVSVPPSLPHQVSSAPDHSCYTHGHASLTDTRAH